MRIGSGVSRTAKWLMAAVMAFSVSTAMAQITNTRHNLGTTAGNPGVTKTSGAGTSTAEICVFCHTPHAADVSTAGVPLWNKRLNTGSATAFTTYSSSTMNSVLANDGQAGNVSIGSVSLACLSCHDGTQAMDNILNAPGSGGYDVTGGGTAGLGYLWAGNANLGGQMTNAATTLSMLGRDLNNDHPIGIQYCGGGPGVTTPGTACPGGAGVEFVTPQNAVIGGQTTFWVDTGTVGVRTKSDMILYNRAFPANAGSGTAAGIFPSVECGSCHDPHTNANPTFLRVSNAGSGVCLACHVK